jgi:hypothetical protein
MKSSVESKENDKKEKITLTPEIIKDAIETIQKAISDQYVFPEHAEKLTTTLQERFDNNEYNSITNPEDFATTLTEHLHQVVKDGHLRLIPRSKLPSGLPSKKMGRKKEKKSKILNKGMTKVEILEGNIGYVPITLFQPLKEVASTIEAIMKFVKDTDALIFDMRQCRGGHGDAVHYLQSYFFGGGCMRLLVKSYFRPNDLTIQRWAMHTPLKYEKPVYILAGKKTFSAGEDFVFTFKIHKRAIIIGDNTGGGAHPCSFTPIGETGLLFSVPIGRTFDPETGKDWEGTGVEPDKRISEEKALDEALNQIKNKNNTNSSN